MSVTEELMDSSAPVLLSSAQMAEFAAKGVLRMDAVVPDACARGRTGPGAVRRVAA